MYEAIFYIITLNRTLINPYYLITVRHLIAVVQRTMQELIVRVTLVGKQEHIGLQWETNFLVVPVQLVMESAQITVAVDREIWLLPT